MFGRGFMPYRESSFPIILCSQLPMWIPAHVALSFATGTILILAGIGLAFNCKVRTATIALGTFTLAIVLLIYVPILVASPSNNDALNYAFDTLLYSGGALRLARGLSREQRQRSSSAERPTTITA